MFQHFQNGDCKTFEIYKHELNVCHKCIVLGLFKVSWCFEEYIILVLGARVTSRNPEIIEVKGFLFALKQMDKLLRSPK